MRSVLDQRRVESPASAVPATKRRVDALALHRAERRGVTGRGRAVAGGMAILVAGLVVGGCGLNPVGSKYAELPESAFVEDAPWPRLADGPPPIDLEELTSNGTPLADKGGEIEADLAAEAAALRAEEAQLRARPVLQSNLQRDAARVRARARALRAADRAAAEQEAAQPDAETQ